jgi:very-short-patch-repair endonuclease
MSKKYLKTGYRKSASSYHKKLGDIIQKHPVLKNLRVYQEYPVPGTRYKIDWFFPDLKLAIEIQGEQHYNLTGFDNHDLGALEKRQIADRCKKNAILEQRWKLVAIPYRDINNEASVLQKIADCLAGG